MGFDCQECAACCMTCSVPVHEDLDKGVPEEHVSFSDPSEIIYGPTFFGDETVIGLMKKTDGDCVCLQLLSGNRDEGTPKWACSIYESRPYVCRDFEPGSHECIECRRIVGYE